MKKEDPTKYYRWQFLRRNKMYREFFNWFNESLKKENYFRNQPSHSEVDWQNNIEDANKEVFEEYAITEVVDYNLVSLSNNVSIGGESDFIVKKGSLDKIFRGRLKENQIISGYEVVETKELVSWEDEECKAEYLPKYIQVVINCDAGITRIKKSLEDILVSVQAPRGINSRKMKCDLDLLIYDTAQQFKVKDRISLTVKKLKKRLPPKNHARDRNPETRVRDALNRMHELIDLKGYKHFLF